MAPPNILPIHGNEKTMNMNPMILTNIQSSPYFKVKLYELKTYHEVVDEIYFKVSHMEPWEKGSRKTSGQTGMCGGVRGVGAGGIVSSAYCLLYKLFTLRLTRKQLNGLLTHADSVFIRALGFMYIRYTQPPGDFWEWFKPYLDDEEEIDVKAGGGHNITIGEMLRTWLTKLEWYSTLFPRIPVPIQKSIETNLREWEEENQPVAQQGAQARRPVAGEANNAAAEEDNNFGEAERHSKLRESPVRNYGGRRGTPPFDIAGEMDKERKHTSHKHRSKSRERERKRSRSRDRERRRSREKDRGCRSRSYERKRSRSRDRHDRDKRSKEKRRSRSRDRHERKRSRSKERKRHRSRSKDRHYRDRDRGRESSFERDLRREKDRHRKKDRRREDD